MKDFSFCTNYPSKEDLLVQGKLIRQERKLLEEIRQFLNTEMHSSYVFDFRSHFDMVLICAVFKEDNNVSFAEYLYSLGYAFLSIGGKRPGKAESFLVLNYEEDTNYFFSYMSGVAMLCNQVTLLIMPKLKQPYFFHVPTGNINEIDLRPLDALEKAVYGYTKIMADLNEFSLGVVEGLSFGGDSLKPVRYGQRFEKLNPVNKREELMRKLTHWLHAGEIKEIVYDHKLYWRPNLPELRGVRPLKNGRLALSFWNKEAGFEEVRVYDVWKNFSSRRNDPLISPLFNPEYFKRVYLYNEYACWGSSRELSKEVLYEDSDIVREEFEDLDWSKKFPANIHPKFTGLRVLKKGRLALEYVHWYTGRTEVKVTDMWKYYELKKEDPYYKSLYNPKIFNKAFLWRYEVHWPSCAASISLDDLYDIGETFEGYFTDVV